jgi:hypothetical protein
VRGVAAACREAKRAERAKRERVAEETRRIEVDKLHAKLGLPPVDWDGRP